VLSYTCLFLFISSLCYICAADSVGILVSAIPQTCSIGGVNWEVLSIGAGSIVVTGSGTSSSKYTVSSSVNNINDFAGWNPTATPYSSPATLDLPFTNPGATPCSLLASTSATSYQVYGQTAGRLPTGIFTTSVGASPARYWNTNASRFVLPYKGAQATPAWTIQKIAAGLFRIPGDSVEGKWTLRVFEQIAFTGCSTCNPPIPAGDDSLRMAWQLSSSFGGTPVLKGTDYADACLADKPKCCWDRDDPLTATTAKVYVITSEGPTGCRGSFGRSCRNFAYFC